MDRKRARFPVRYNLNYLSKNQYCSYLDCTRAGPLHINRHRAIQRHHVNDRHGNAVQLQDIQINNQVIAPAEPEIADLELNFENGSDDETTMHLNNINVETQTDILAIGSENYTAGRILSRRTTTDVQTQTIDVQPELQLIQAARITVRRATNNAETQTQNGRLVAVNLRDYVTNISSTSKQTPYKTLGVNVNDSENGLEVVTNPVLTVGDHSANQINEKSFVRSSVNSVIPSTATNGVVAQLTDKTPGNSFLQ